MKCRICTTALGLLMIVGANPAAKAADVTPEAIADQLQHLSLDASQTFRVRELQIARSGVKIYLGEGILSFLSPVGGQVIGAVFTTQGVDAGDAEILALPPSRAERASLASFTKSPTESGLTGHSPRSGRT